MIAIQNCFFRRSGLFTWSSLMSFCMAAWYEGVGVAPMKLNMGRLKLVGEDGAGMMIGVPQDETFWKFCGEICSWSQSKTLILFRRKKKTLFLENYIQKHLPLADKRDEKQIKYPLKNWNVRLIEDNDPAFNLLIQEHFKISIAKLYYKSEDY